MKYNWLLDFHPRKRNTYLVFWSKIKIKASFGTRMCGLSGKSAKNVALPRNYRLLLKPTLERPKLGHKYGAMESCTVILVQFLLLLH